MDRESENNKYEVYTHFSFLEAALGVQSTLTSIASRAINLLSFFVLAIHVP